MKIGKRVTAVLLYLILVSLFLGLRIGELLDIGQILLVFAGGMMLYMAGMEKGDWRKRRKPDWKMLARDAVYASFIVTFVLLFLMLSEGRMAGGEGDLAEGMAYDGTVGAKARSFMRGIALNMRPLLYGICIWIALGGDEEKKRDPGRKKETEEAWTAQEAFRRFLELGLTRREAEIAVQVCKGLGNKEIGLELNISEATVKKHISHIFEKLDVEKRQEIMESGRKSWKG